MGETGGEVGGRRRARLGLSGEIHGPQRVVVDLHGFGQS